MKDSTKHKGLRNQLVKSVRSKGIVDEKVLSAIAKIPRHLFMDSGFIDFAYQDNAFPIAAIKQFLNLIPLLFKQNYYRLKKTIKY